MRRVTLFGLVALAVLTCDLLLGSALTLGRDGMHARVAHKSGGGGARRSSPPIRREPGAARRADRLARVANEKHSGRRGVRMDERRTPLARHLARLPRSRVATPRSVSAPQLGQASAAAPVAGLSLSQGPLVIEAIQTLDSGQQVEDSRQAKLASPLEVRLREESQTKFQGLGPEAAAKLAGETFPELVEHPAGGPPPLPAGESITSYPSDFAARVSGAGDGGRAVIDSLAPIALETSPGTREPINLAPRSEGGGFTPSLSPSAVRIGKHLSEGATLAAVGVTLTPVNAQGKPLQGHEATITGASLFYAASGADMDSLLKPTTFGFEESTILRAADAPRSLYFRIGLPAGASVADRRGGSLEVMKEGAVIASVLSPSAEDAAGTPVPVSVSVHGQTLTLAVGGSPSEFRYPIEVDPRVAERNDPQVLPAGGRKSNWHESWNGWPTPRPQLHFAEPPASQCSNCLEDWWVGEHTFKEWAAFGYQTQGDSRVYIAAVNFRGAIEPLGSEEQDVNLLFLQSPALKVESIEWEQQGSHEGNVYDNIAPSNPPGGSAQPCNEGETPCEEQAEQRKHNQVVWQQIFHKPTSGIGYSGFNGRLEGADVEIEQGAKPSAAHVNTQESLLFGNEAGKPASEAFQNGAPGAPVPGGHRIWASPAQGAALGLEAEDPGVGIYKVRARSAQEVSGENPYREWSAVLPECEGIQCVEAWQAPNSSKTSFGWHYERTKYQPLIFPLFRQASGSECGAQGGSCKRSWLAEGEDHVTLEVEDAMGHTSSLEELVRVTESPPEGLSLSGLPEKGEIGEGLYHLQAQASGKHAAIASLSLSLDGRPVAPAAGSCRGKAARRAPRSRSMAPNTRRANTRSR